MSDSDTTLPLNHEAEVESSSPQRIEDDRQPAASNSPVNESNEIEAKGEETKKLEHEETKREEVEAEEQMQEMQSDKVASDQETESVAPRSPSPDRTMLLDADRDIVIKPAVVDVENPATTLAVMTKDERNPSIVDGIKKEVESKHVPVEDTGMIRCICGIDDDDGFTICCDRCLVWQHGECVTLYSRAQLEKNESLLPEQYLCDRCNPRDFDIERAVRLQKERIASESKPQSKTRRAGGAKSRNNNNNHNSPASGSGHTPRDDGSDSAARKSGTSGKGDAKRPRMTPKASSESTTTAKQSHAPSPNEASESEYKVEYIPIAECEALTSDNVDNVRLCAEIAQNISREGNFRISREKLSNTVAESGADAIRQLKTFPPRSIPKVCVHRVQHKSDKLSYRGPKFELHAAQDFRADDFIIEYVGQLYSVWDYKNDPINQYQRTGYMKRHVLFSPLSEVDLCIDARRKGNEARFVRGSCKPNAVLNIVTTLKPGVVRFGLFAATPISDGAEITAAHFTNLTDSKIFKEAMEESQMLLPLSENLQPYVEIAQGVLSCNGCGCNGVDCKLAMLAIKHSNRISPLPAEPPTEVLDKPDHTPQSRQQSREASVSNRELSPGSDEPNDTNAITREERKNRAAVAQFERAELAAKMAGPGRKISGKRESQSGSAQKRKRSKSASDQVESLISPKTLSPEQPVSSSSTPRMKSSGDNDSIPTNSSKAESPSLTAVPIEIINRLKRKSTQDDGYIHPKRMLLARYLSDHAQKAAQASVIHHNSSDAKHSYQADLHISMPPPLFLQDDPTSVITVPINTPSILSTPGTVPPSPLDGSLASPITPSIRTKKLSLSEYRARYKKESSQPPTPQVTPFPPVFNGSGQPDANQHPSANGVEHMEDTLNITAIPPSPMEPSPTSAK